MALLKFNKGEFAKLPTQITEGNVYITTDEHAMYVDISSSSRIRIGQIVQLTETEWLKKKPPFNEDTFYYITDKNALLKNVGGSWIQINSTELLATKISDLETRATNIENAASALTTRVSNNETSIGNINGSISNINSAANQLTNRVKALEDVGAQANVIESITVNNTPVTITNKTVALGKLAGVNAKVSSSDLDTALSTRISTAETNISNLDSNKADKTALASATSDLQGKIDTANGNITNINNIIGKGSAKSYGRKI